MQESRRQERRAGLRKLSCAPRASAIGIGEKMTSLLLGHLLEEVLGHEMPAFSSKSTGLLPAGWGEKNPERESAAQDAKNDLEKSAALYNVGQAKLCSL